MRWSSWILVVAMGCGHCGASSGELEMPAADPAPAPTSPSSPSPEGAPAADEAQRGPSLVLGVEALPEEPDAALRASIRAALRTHRRGDYARSEEAFRELAEAHPKVPALRFDLACALARQGRSAESRQLLEALFIEDLPSYLPKFLGDEDLEDLRQSPEGEALRRAAETITLQYRLALRAGFIVLRDVSEGAHEPAGHVASVRESAGLRRMRQAGVWLPNERRFVPMGPRLSQSFSETYFSPGYHRLVGTQVDRRFSVVYGLTAMGSESEGGPELAERAVLGVWEAITGRELGRHVYPAITPPHMHAHRGGLSYRLSFPLNENFYIGDSVAASLGAEGAFDEDYRPALSCSGSSCSPLYRVDDVSAAPDFGTPNAAPEPNARDRRRMRESPPALVLELGSEAAPAPRRVELPPIAGWGHSDQATPNVQAVRDGAGGVWIVVEQGLSCDWQYGVGASAAFYLDLASGELRLKRSGRGRMRLRSGPDHAVYLQFLYELQRYVGGEAEGAPLPTGLTIDPAVPRVWSLQAFRDC